MVQLFGFLLLLSQDLNFSSILDLDMGLLNLHLIDLVDNLNGRAVL